MPDRPPRYAGVLSDGWPWRRHAPGLAAKVLGRQADDQRIPANVMMMNKRRVAAMHAAGVRIVSGSDGGINAAKPHGLLPLSIAAMVEGGVDTVAALASATSLAAEACGFGDSTGRLRAGYAADILLVDGNVIDDIAVLTRPAATFAAGHRVEAAAIRSS